MQKTRVVQAVILAIFSIAQLAGCSIGNRIFPDKSDDYVNAKTAEKLEVPPDLRPKELTDDLIDRPARKVPAAGNLDESVNDRAPIRETVSTPVAQKTAMQNAGTQNSNVVFKRDGDTFWLDVKGDPATIWPKARQFWLDKEFELTLDDAAIGVLETDWVNSRAITPGTGKNSIIGRVFSNEEVSVYRDRYRMRVEQGVAAGTSEIYIKHQGIEEVLEGASDEIPVSRWIPRPSESGLESEMLKRLMLSLGASVYDAQRPVSAKATKGAEAAMAAPVVQSELKKGYLGKATIVIQQGFQVAWESVGRAMKEAGVKIDDLNRSKGVYYVQPDDIPENKKKKGSGLFSGILGGEVRGVDTEEEYDEGGRLLVKVEEADSGVTEVVVTNEAGVRDNTKLANHLLKMIQKNIE